MQLEPQNGIFVFVFWVSGRKQGRLQLKELMKAAKNHEFDGKVSRAVVGQIVKPVRDKHKPA